MSTPAIELSSSVKNGVTARVVMSKFNGVMNDDGSALLIVNTVTIKTDSAGEEITRSDGAQIVATVPVEMAGAVIALVKAAHNASAGT